MKKLHAWSDPGIIIEMRQWLQGGQVIASTTDTVPGLLALCTQGGFEALNEIKGRQNKPYLLLIGSRGALDQFVDVSTMNNQAELLMHHFWPGPLTLILKAHKQLPPFLTAADGTIAVRMPRHEGLQQLLTFFPALFSTSANLSGNPVPRTLAELDPAVVQQVTLCVNGEHSAQLPSTLVDCTGDTARIVREGAVTRDEIEQVVSNK